MEDIKSNPAGTAEQPSPVALKVETGRIGLELAMGHEPGHEATWNSDGGDTPTSREALADRELPKPAGSQIVDSIRHPQRFVQPRPPAGR